MVKKITVASLKREIAEHKKAIKNLKLDRDKYRDFIKSEVSAQLNCIKDNSYYTPDDMVKRFLHLAAKVDGFYIWLS